MYSSRIVSFSIALLLVNLLLDQAIAVPIPSEGQTESPSTFSNRLESSSSSSASPALTEQPAPAPTEIASTPDTSDTVAKILRLMHSLSNRNILIPSAPLPNANINPEDVKREENLKEERDHKFKHKKFFGKLNERFIHKERFNDDFEPERSAESLRENLPESLPENLQANLQEKLRPNLRESLRESLRQNLRANLKESLRENLREKFSNNLNENSNENSNENLNNVQLNNDFFEKLREIYGQGLLADSSAKYPATAEQVPARSGLDEFSRTYTAQRLAEMSRANDESTGPRRALLNPAYVRVISDLNDQADEENREQSKLIDKEQLELQSKNHNKNLFDMVENEEEDNLGEEEHMHNYNISLFSDQELNRTLVDILWLLDQNLNKEEMERKFGSKGRNNRNKIASRFEYYDKLYRNLHHLPLMTNTQKRTEGPQLSVVSPLDILRDKLMLEMARRKIEQSKSQLKENEEILKKIG